MMTCVSDRSGMASNGVSRIQWTAPATATIVVISTRDLLRAEKSVIRSILGPSSLAISQRSEVRGQRSEVRGQRSEVRGQRSEVRGQRSEMTDWKYASGC